MEDSCVTQAFPEKKKTTNQQLISTSNVPGPEETGGAHLTLRAGEDSEKVSYQGGREIAKY